MKNLISTFLLFALILTTLTSAKPIKTNTKEAIIIGRLVIDTQSELSTDKTSFYVQYGVQGGQNIKIDKNGFFSRKVKIRNASFIDYIQYKENGDFRKIFSENCLTFILPQHNVIYNLGDIQVKWTPSDRDKIKKGFSLGFGMGGPHMGGGVSIPVSSAYTPEQDCPQITVFENDSIVSWYKQNYPDDEREIINQYIKVLED